MKSIEKLIKAFIGVLLVLLLVPFESAMGAIGTWVTKAPMPVIRYSNTVAGIGNILYAAGGDNYSCIEYSALDVYDPSTNSWSSKSPMPTPRSNTGSAVVNGIFYVIGGNGWCSEPNYTNVEAYDPATDSWSSKAPLPSGRRNFGIGAIGNTIYVVGGMASGGGVADVVNTVFAYDTVTDTWSSKASMPTARFTLGVGVVNGIIYAAGGSDGVRPPLTIVEAYEPITNTWTTVAPMATGRGYFGVGVINNVLYVVGGSVGTGSSSAAVESYNPLTNTWSAVPPMSTARQAHQVGVVDNTLYAVGGYTTGPASMVEAYTPNQPPIANAGIDQNIYFGLTAFLNGSRSSDPDLDPLSYSWTLDTAPVGSAAILSGATTVNPSLTPDVAGTYHISLVVSDGQVRSAASTVTINVSLNLPPVAAATGNPVLGYAPLQVTFDAGASRDPENSALTYSWNFGDPVSGANNTSTIVNPIHSYTAVGNYTAVVTVMDNFGKTDQASVAITITAPNLPPVVSPTATPSNGVAPLSVQFAANATDVNLSDVLSYSWNFGDGSAASTLANPQHTYATGTYTAVVTVSDGVNAPVSANLTISVGSALTINVTEAKVERGEKGKVEGKISMQADFNFAGMPWGGDMILVKFDGITLLNVPFSSFRQESAGKFEYETRTQDAEINFNRRTIKVSSHKILTGLVDNSNGIDVVISFGVATATDNFVMRNHKGDKGDQDSELSHKK